MYKLYTILAVTQFIPVLFRRCMDLHGQFWNLQGSHLGLIMMDEWAAWDLFFLHFSVTFFYLFRLYFSGLNSQDLTGGFLFCTGAGTLCFVIVLWQGPAEQAEQFL